MGDIAPHPPFEGHPFWCTMGSVRLFFALATIPSSVFPRPATSLIRHSTTLYPSRLRNEDLHFFILYLLGLFLPISDHIAALYAGFFTW